MIANDPVQEWTEDSVLAVSVIVGRGKGPGGADQWRVMGVVVGERFASDEIRMLRLRSGPEGDIFMWLGYRLRLRRTKVDDYALNINSPNPVAFVVARHTPEGLKPLQVTVSLDEAQNLDATDLRGSDETVLQAPMPPEVFRWVEQYVLEHYRPKRRKARGKQRSKAAYDAEVGDYAGDDA
jgi:hypothetical protein